MSEAGGTPYPECAANERDVWTSESAAETFDFTIEGLCAGTDYTVGFEITDESGVVTRYGMYDEQNESERYWYQTAKTEPYRFDGQLQIDLAVVAITVDGQAGGARKVRNAGIAVEVDGRDHELFETSECLRAGTSDDVSTQNDAFEFGEFIDVVVSFDAVPGLAACPGGNVWDHYRFTTRVRTEDFLAGTPINLSSPDGDAVQVTASVRAVARA